MTWVYADTDDRLRRNNWETLRQIGRTRTGPWICQGDFNAIMNHREKEGGRRKSQRTIDDFNEMIHDIGMDDMGSKGQHYTWCNNRRGEERIYERLDRALINCEWARRFPNALCTNEVAIGSYHSPIVVTLDRQTQRRKRGFKFEEMWFEHSDCKEVVKRAWQERADRAQGSKLWTRLGHCRRRLMKWSRVSFGNNITEM